MPHWRCGEAPVWAIVSFSKRRLFSIGGGHQVVRTLTMLPFLPTWCPKTTYTVRQSSQKSVFLLPGQLRLCCQVSYELAATAQQHWPLPLCSLCSAGTPPTTFSVRALGGTCVHSVSCVSPEMAVLAITGWFVSWLSVLICCVLIWQFLVSILIFPLLKLLPNIHSVWSDY